MLKVKPEQTADCVVAGFRWLVDRPLPSSLLLGLHDDDNALRHVGIAASFAEPRRRELLSELQPLITTLDGHPWEQGFLLGRKPDGSVAGRRRPLVARRDGAGLDARPAGARVRGHIRPRR